MLGLLCFLIDAALLCLILLILYSIKPIPLYIGSWEIKRTSSSQRKYGHGLFGQFERTLKNFYKFQLELTLEGNYFANSNVYKESSKYEVVGGGEYLIIRFGNISKISQEFELLHFEDKIMIGGVCNFLVFKILDVGESAMRLKKIPFDSSSNKFPYAFQIRRQEMECNKNKVKMPEVTLKCLGRPTSHLPFFPLKKRSDILPNFMKGSKSKKKGKFQF